MDSSAINAMGARAVNALDVTMLKKAMDIQSSSAAQLLQTIPDLPQAEGKGLIVDVQA